VERSDSTLFPSGIAEAQAGTPAQALPSWATLVSGRVRITCRSAVVYDASGHRVFAGPGPVDAAFASGVYFARVVDADGRMVTGRVTVAARGTNRR